MTLYLTAIVIRSLKQKKGARAKEYDGLDFTTKLKDTVRHIIFEYNIREKNSDFLLNVRLNNLVVMQLMHRAHFPELNQTEEDIGFGMALYIPAINLKEGQIDKIREIVDEEVETLKETKDGPVDYFLIDLGTRVRFGGYFLSRIIREVFGGSENQFSSELFSEGKLPYKNRR